MKLSLRWIFDHIQGVYSHYDAHAIAAKFNTAVAEIEAVETVSFDISAYQLGVIADVTPQEIVLFVPELDTHVTLPLRKDILDLDHCAYMIKPEGDGYVWARLKDFNMDKDGLVPMLFADALDIEGEWRTKFEADDVLFDVDNKSVTHRPDMWGHRGFAREIAALLQLDLKSDAQFLHTHTVKRTVAYHNADGAGHVVENRIPEKCSILAGLTLHDVGQHPTDITMLSRFVKVGIRPINAVVDATNYVMLDWGHPMHAYDEQLVEGGYLCVRAAHPGEELTVLDGKTLILHEHDLVVTDSKKVLGLAGIMGGKGDSVGPKTTTLFLEAACFDAATIRRTALRHKLRTESSQRFEKTLDPEMAIQALQRFLVLADEMHLPYSLSNPIIVVGKPYEPTIIEVAYEFILKRLGIFLSVDDVVTILNRLEFEVGVQPLDDGTLLHITVPSFRASKDVGIAEDIVEEIARFYGFENITPTMPALLPRADLAQTVRRRYQLKDFFAYGLQMQEQKNYALYDEKILSQLGWQEPAELFLQNPVSQDAYRLVSSLLPHLLKNIEENCADNESLRFFEFGPVWSLQQGAPYEVEHCAAVWFKRRGAIDFYQLKQSLLQLFHQLRMTVEWRPATFEQGHPVAWYDRARAAHLYHEDRYIGTFGLVKRSIIQTLSVLPESTLYAFELNASLLLEWNAPVVQVQDLAKYPSSSFDISVVIPMTQQVAHMEKTLRGISELISDVSLIDFFEKKEWIDSRSVAFRIVLRRADRSLLAEEIESVRKKVIALLESEHNAVLRAV